MSRSRGSGSRSSGCCSIRHQRHAILNVCVGEVAGDARNTLSSGGGDSRTTTTTSTCSGGS